MFCRTVRRKIAMSIFDGGVDAVVVAAADAGVDSDAEADVDDRRRVREESGRWYERPISKKMAQ